MIRLLLIPFPIFRSQFQQPSTMSAFMKPSIKQHAITLASLAVLSASAHATVIFTDTFDSGTGAWYRAGTVNTLSNSSGQLAWSGSVGSGGGGDYDAVREVIGRAMTAQTLTMGQTLRLTFDYTQTVATAGDILRVGFYNVGTPPTADGWSTSGTTIGAFSGYTTFVRDDNATGNLARSETATDTTATSTGPTMAATANITSPTNTQKIDIAVNTTYQAVFDVTLTSATQVNTLFTLSNGFSVAGQTSTVYNGFDMVVLRTVNPALFDNIQVSVIPEPGSALLGGLGMLLALLRRRR